MTLFDSLIGGSTPTTTTTGGGGGGPSAAIAYTNVRLVPENNTIDLYIHNSRGKGIFTYDSWLEEGRPRQLSSLNLSTWSLLTTSIKEYQLGLRQYAGRIYVRMILPVYILWFICLFWFGFDDDGNEQDGGLYIMWSWIGLILMVIVSLGVASHFQQHHVDTVFNPSVQSVLNELRPKLTDSGWDVTLMVDTGRWFVKPTKSFLRFTPLADEEKVAKEQQQQQHQ